MSAFIALINLLWSVRIVGNLLSYLHLWWVKEYRVDRMLIHLRTEQGKRWLLPGWRPPPLNPKTIILGVTAGGIILITYLWLPLALFLKLLLIDLFTFPLTFFLVFLVSLPTKIYHAWIIRQAVKKLRRHQPMLVIGITGSYGKTSTKDYLAAILATQFKVLKTSASKNSAIGIAEVVLRNLRPEHEVLVVEMGAYKRGEIKQMAGMVRPQIGIITAINAQHQDLFGSLENTMQAKSELTAGLIGRRIAIFNADNPLTLEMAEKAKREGLKVWLYGRKSKEQSEAEQFFRATEIQADLRQVSFMCEHGEEKCRVETKVLGEHQVGNILAALAAAVACGLTLKEAARAAREITAPAGVMQPVRGIKGASFLDDTFNNNPDAALAALKFIAKYPGKKILVFQPMIELGKYAQTCHRQVGELAAKICDSVILTNSNWSRDFKFGLSRVAKKVPVSVSRPDQAAAFIRSAVGKGDVVLFKGKEAKNVLNRLV